MSDALIQKARDRIRFHEAEIAKLREFITTAESLIDEGAPTLPVFGSAHAQNEPGDRGTTSADTPISATSVILAEAEDILRQKNAPMPAAEIYEKLLRRGVKISGQNPKANLTAKFATKKHVFVVDKDTRLWSLTEWNRADGESPNSKPSALDLQPSAKGREAGPGGGA